MRGGKLEKLKLQQWAALTSATAKEGSLAAVAVAVAKEGVVAAPLQSLCNAVPIGLPAITQAR